MHLKNYRTNIYLGLKLGGIRIVAEKKERYRKVKKN